MTEEVLPAAISQERKKDEEDLRLAYQEVCRTYHGIDDFRAKLLGLLPLATGAGLLVLQTKQATSVRNLAVAAGVFGFVATIGLFAYELHGIKRCHYILHTGTQLEHDLGVFGQFSSRPPKMGHFDEPFAASVIYSASLAGWAVLAFSFSFLGWDFSFKWLVLAAVAALVFAVSFWRSRVLIHSMVSDFSKEYEQMRASVQAQFNNNGTDPA